MRETENVFPGQRVITSAGTVRVVALVQGNVVFAFGPRGTPEPVRVLYDALGGEAGAEDRDLAPGATRSLAA